MIFRSLHIVQLRQDLPGSYFEYGSRIGQTFRKYSGFAIEQHDKWNHFLEVIWFENSILAASIAYRSYYNCHWGDFFVGFLSLVRCAQ